MVRGPLGHISAISLTPLVLDRDCFVFLPKNVPWEEDILAKSPFDYLVDGFRIYPIYTTVAPGPMEHAK